MPGSDDRATTAGVDRVVVRTHELRPHDRVVRSSDGSLEPGSEVRLVIDAAGNPFPRQLRSAILQVLDAAGGEAISLVDASWEVIREPLDDCRPCFLFEAASRGRIAS